MPATYAHFRMGQQITKYLKEEQYAVVKKYPQLYRIGFHGPDILFYYNPLSSNPVNQIGHELHDSSGRYFFDYARKVLEEHPGDDRYLAYVYGVLTHFALDYSCHGYVEEKINESGISHTEIEVEFDRFLMEMDGKDARSNLTSMHIAATKENAKVISAFYPGATPDQVLASLRDMVMFHKLLLCPGTLKGTCKRRVLYTLMKLAGCYDSMKDQIMKPEQNPLCQDSNEELYRRYCDARKLAIDFIHGFDLLDPMPEEIDWILDYNFCSVLAESEDSL